jgi:hypothetical protein
MENFPVVVVADILPEQMKLLDWFCNSIGRLKVFQSAFMSSKHNLIELWITNTFPSHPLHHYTSREIQKHLVFMSRRR